MKLKHLFALAALLIGGGGNSWAQSWTGNAVAEGTFYLYNVGAERFLSAGNKSDDSWGTNANLVANSNLDVELIYISDGVYQIDTKLSNGGDNHFLAASTWCDGAPIGWTFRAVEGETNVYQIIYDGQYIMATESLDDVEMLGDPGSRTTSTYWKLVTKEDRINALSSATESNAKDATFLITAPNFGRNDTRNSTWQGSPSIGGKDNKASCNFNAEKFNTTFDVYQTISNVPNGWYKLYVQGYYRDGDIAPAATAYIEGTDKLYANYYINSVSAPLMSIFDDSGKTGNNGSTQEGVTGKFPNNRENQMDAFNAGLYENVPLIVKVTDGNIRVGVKAETKTENAWTGFDNFRLEYLGTTEPEVQGYVKLKNPSPFVHATGWITSVAPNAYDATKRCAEFWKQKAASISQTVSDMPVGYYQLNAIALQRNNRKGTVSLNDESVTIAYCGSDVSSRAAADDWFNAGNGVNTVTYHLMETGAVTIKLQADGATDDYWTVWRSFELKYLGEYPLSIKQQELADAVAEAQGLYSSLPAAALSALQSVVDAKNITYSTGREYSDAADAVNAAIATARTIITSYERYKNVKQAALVIASATETTAADAAIAAATTDAAIDEAVVTLRTAFQTALANVEIPADPGYIDVTSVLVDNASVRQSTDYWTKEGTWNGRNSFGVVDYEETEFYSHNFKFYQTLALNPGTWEFGVTGFHRAGNHNTNFYAGEDKILIPGVESSVVNTMAQAKTYFDNGNGKVALKFLIEQAQDVEIGINNQDTETDKWTIFRDFTLKYYGVPNYQVYEDQWAALVNDANTAKTSSPNAIGTELTTLNAAIADSPVGANLKATYLAKIEALQTALSAFNTAAPNYEALAREIVKAKALGIEASAAEAYAATAETTAAIALANTQALMVDEYNYVATNYNNAVNLGTWNASDNAGTMTSQHWDGTAESSYLEQGAGNLAYNLDSWTVTYDQTLNLPAGNYIFKVAGRTATDHVTLTLNVTDVTAAENPVLLGTVNDFPKGDVGLGINTDGATDFTTGEGHTYANNGKGRGWQWRYVKFTLEAPASVKVAVLAVADAKNRWMGFCNATVQTDDADNVEIMEALVALNDAKTAATITRSENAGTGVFQLETSNEESLWNAYSTAKSNAEAFTLTAQTAVADVAALTTALTTAQNAYVNNQVINAPDAAKRYKLTLANKGALTFLKGGSADNQGVYGLPFQAAADYKAQAFQFEAVAGKDNTYLLYFTDNEGQKRYICNGVPYNAGTGTSGIRTLLASDIDAENNKTALEIQVQASATNGVFYMLNTSASNAKLGAENDGSMYTSATNSNWSIAEAAEVSMTVSCKAGKYGTIIFPFTPAVAGNENVKFYTVTGVNATTGKVQMEEVTTLEANKPYLIQNEGTENYSENLTGYGLAAADSYSEGGLTGVYTAATIPASTETQVNYVLQTQGDVQAFYKVDSDFTATANKCYLTVAQEAASGVKAFGFGFDVATGVDNVNAKVNANDVIFNLAGQRVSKLQKGINIVNGKKVLVK